MEPEAHVVEFRLALGWSPMVFVVHSPTPETMD